MNYRYIYYIYHKPELIQPLFSGNWTLFNEPDPHPSPETLEFPGWFMACPGPHLPGLGNSKAEAATQEGSTPGDSWQLILLGKWSHFLGENRWCQ